MKAHPTAYAAMAQKVTVVCVAAAMTFGISGTAWAVGPIEVGYDLIEFTNPETDLSTDDTDDIGLDAALGDVVEYENVFPGVDAKVTVLDITNLQDEVDKIDEGQDSTAVNFDDTPMWVEIDPPGTNGEPAIGGPGSATLRVDFFVSGGTFTAPVTLNEIGITLKDVDSDQYVTFYDASSYALSSEPETVLTATVEDGDVTIADISGETASALDEENWATVTYAAAESITVTVGTLQADDAEFGLLFTVPDLSADPTEILLGGAEEDNLADTGANGVTILGAFGLALAVAGTALARSSARRR